MSISIYADIIIIKFHNGPLPSQLIDPHNTKEYFKFSSSMLQAKMGCWVENSGDRMIISGSMLTGGMWTPSQVSSQHLTTMCLPTQSSTDIPC